jgi:hypothetical protein
MYSGYGACKPRQRKPADASEVGAGGARFPSHRLLEGPAVQQDARAAEPPARGRISEDGSSPASRPWRFALQRGARVRPDLRRRLIACKQAVEIRPPAGRSAAAGSPKTAHRLQAGRGDSPSSGAPGCGRISEDGSSPASRPWRFALQRGARVRPDMPAREPRVPYTHAGRIFPRPCIGRLYSAGVCAYSFGLPVVGTGCPQPTEAR